MDPEVEHLMERYSNVFSHNGEIGRISTEQCKIRLKNDTPITIRPYKCSIVDQVQIQNQIERLKEQQLIEKSKSPYAFPVVLVVKKDDGKKMWKKKTTVN